ncbi:hypothetical protein ARMSODRAFT_957489 [Armillaria solidipes]|uniref:Uncharacterized protein n=1 Tax=Armillaria solidipes TaxID=1076256 RepID=A0A2H3BJR9_9AGAR|nr:hypothetical protein ARMSODRAFT_957489 [Armillaria solidipes]
MGTRGNYIYRWKGWYFVHYQNYDSYPEGLGLEVLREVPPANCDPADFEKWSRQLAGHLDDELKEYKMEERRCAMHEVSDDYYISHDQPEYDVFIEWSYEIDLDNLVFHINHTPMFRLDCMPSSDDFCRFISWDHYGERSYAEDMPERHRYEANWHPSPPEISDEQLEAYKRLEATIAGKGDISPLAMSVVSRTRIRLLEALIGRTMGGSLVTRYRIFNLDNIPSRDSFTEKSLCTLYTFAFTALSSCKYRTPWEPNVFCDYPAKVSEEHSLAVWLRENLCVFTWTHLYDEPNLKAAVVAITTCLRSQSPASNSFGVAFSLFHCVIVKLEGETGKVTHTGALDFLPSWYAYSPSTPGITALARLSEYLDHLSLGHPDVAVWTTKPLHTPLPLEMLTRISEYINDSTTLLAYARASVQTRAACQAMLMTPWVKDLQLVAVHPDSVLGDGSSPLSARGVEVEGDDDEKDEDEDEFDFLYNAKFFTQILDEKHPESVFTVLTKQNQEVFDGVSSHKY